MGHRINTTGRTMGTCYYSRSSRHHLFIFGIIVITNQLYNSITMKYAYPSIIVILIIAFGYVAFVRPAPIAGAPSPVGTFQSTPQIAQISITPTTSTGTSTFILNNSNDRAIYAFESYCSGVGSSIGNLGAGGWTLTAATSSTITTTSTNSNYAASLNIATTSSIVYAATSTWGAGADLLRLWPAGTYLGLFYNATNTAACTDIVKFVQL